jgi:hypothetical protein
MYTERSLSSITFALTVKDKGAQKASEGDLRLAQVDVQCEVKSFLHAQRTTDMQTWCFINFNVE